VKALGCLEPTFQPRATEFVAPRADGRSDMITLIQRLIERGYAYEAAGEVLRASARTKANEVETAAVMNSTSADEVSIQALWPARAALAVCVFRSASVKPSCLVLAGLTSLLPLLLIAIRWPSTFGETSPAGVVITTSLFRVVHVAFLVAGLWTAFDGKISARSLVDRKFLQFTDEAMSGLPFLTFYYLGALCLGYFVGYFLLVFGPSTGKSWQKAPPSTRPLNRLMAGLVWLFGVAALLGTGAAWLLQVAGERDRR